MLVCVYANGCRRRSNAVCSRWTHHPVSEAREARDPKNDYTFTHYFITRWQAANDRIDHFIRVASAEARVTPVPFPNA